MNILEESAQPEHAVASFEVCQTLGHDNDDGGGGSGSGGGGGGLFAECTSNDCFTFTEFRGEENDEVEDEDENVDEDEDEDEEDDESSSSWASSISCLSNHVSCDRTTYCNKIASCVTTRTTAASGIPSSSRRHGCRVQFGKVHITEYDVTNNGRDSPRSHLLIYTLEEYELIRTAEKIWSLQSCILNINATLPTNHQRRILLKKTSILHKLQILVLQLENRASASSP